MAVGIISNFGPGTGETYDAMRAEMGVDENPPEGLIFHWAGSVDGNWTITDVWESREHWERFNSDRVMPALEKVANEAAAGAPPEVTEAQVHNYLKP